MTGYSFGFLAALLLSALISALVAWMAFKRRQVNGALSLAFMMAATVLWTISYFLQMISGNLGWAIIWSNTTYISVAFIPMTWLVFAIQYSQQEKAPPAMRLAWLALPPLLTVVMFWTNDLHKLVWLNHELENIYGLSVLHGERGFYYWAHTIFSYIFMLVGTVVFVRSAIRSAASYRGQAISMLAGVFSVLIANGISVFADAQLRGLDITPFAFTVSGVFIATGLFRYGLLEQPPIDNQTIIDNIPDPLLVINENRRILYMNHAFEKLAGLTPGTSLKQPVRDVLPNWPDIFTICQHKLRQEITTDGGRQQLALEVQISPLYEGKTQVGCAYTFRDISPTRKAEEPVTRRSIGAEPANLPILVITDAENGAILDVNSEFIFQTGYNREETIGRTLREVGLLDTQTSLALNLMVEKRGSLENEELTVADKNGQGRRWQFSMTPNSLAGRKIIVWAAQLVV